MTTSGGGWSAATASVRGSSHERSGKPNQDTVRVVSARGSTAGLVAAVCDGHGGDRYVRSDVGSRLAAEVACDIGAGALDHLGPSPEPDAVRAHLSGHLAGAIVERWRKRVLDDVDGRSFTDEERQRAGTPLDGDPFISYGCTLLLAVLAPTWVGLLQIGDGDVTVVREEATEAPVPGDDRLVGGETTSLCLPTAAADARVAVLTAPLPELLILTSDGYANSFASATWRTDAGLDLRDQVRRIGLEKVETRLAAWLADSAKAGGDDVSMALINRTDEGASRPGAGAAGLAGVADPTAETTVLEHPTQDRVPIPEPVPDPAPASARRRWPAIVGASLATLALGGGIGWAAASASNDDGTTTTTVPPETSTPGEQVQVMLGQLPMVVAFDPSQPEDPEVRLIKNLNDADVDMIRELDPTALLPDLDDWELEDTTLTGPGGASFEPVAAVIQHDGYLWTVSSVGLVTVIDETTGREVGEGVLDDGAQPPDGTGSNSESLPEGDQDSGQAPPGGDSDQGPSTPTTVDNGSRGPLPGDTTEG